MLTNHSSPLERVLAALPEARQETDRRWKARCPVHDDKQASLSISPGDKGGAVLHCFAGCKTEQIVAALGISMADLMPPRTAPDAGGSGTDLAPRKRRIKTIYPYVDEDGKRLYEVVRFEPKEFRQRRPDPSALGGYIWNLKSVRQVLYRLPQVIWAISQGVAIFVVEGEKDADALCTLGLVATTNAGGAVKWLPEHTTALRGADVVLIPDNDAPGRKHIERVGAALQGVAASVRLIELPDLPEKGDVSDWLAAGGTVAALQAMTESAGPFKPTAADEALVKRSEDRRRQRERRSAEATGADGLPVIETAERHLRDVTADAMAALVAKNDPPETFARGGNLVRIKVETTGDGREYPTLEPHGIDTLTHRLARVANFVSTSANRGTIPVNPPDRVVRDLLASPCFPDIPQIAAIVTAPVVGRDGNLYTTPGYVQSSRVYYYEPIPFDLPDTTATTQNVEAAKVLLLDTLLGDFPFVDDASRAHALALLLLPFVRPCIVGDTPLHLIDAPTPGTGKGLLADTCIAIFLPGGAAKTTAPEGGRGSDDEWRKKITTALQTGAPFFYIDNIVGMLRSASLDAVLTTGGAGWTDRRLQTNEEVRVPVQCVFVGTSNNVQVSRDTSRRVIWIRIDSRMERPEERTDCRIKDLRGYVAENRPILLAAALTLIRRWLDAGRPKWSGQPLGSFEGWSLTVGGLLELIGVPGFLENRKEMVERLDPDGQKWAEFFAEIFERFGSEPFAVSEIAEIACDMDIISDVEKSGRSSLGRLLAARLDGTFGPLQLVSAGRKRHNNLFQLRAGTGAHSAHGALPEV